MMAKVKICGVTTVRDALWAARCGADALGFNFVPGTPRCCDAERVRAIVMELPPFVSAVGVFANARPDRVREIAEQCDLDYVQLHGRESAEECTRLRDLRVIKAFRIRDEEDLRDLERYGVEAYLLDAYVKGKLGGTGESFRWEIARGARRFGQVILAGGLNPDNVVTAVRAARPYAVDVASGVEAEPRKKDKDLVSNFIRSAKSVDV
jgi:phosphoribosylanthranilate isomerase